MDYLLRNRLWNVIKEEFLDRLEKYSGSSYEESQKGQFFILLWKEFFGRMIDDIPRYNNGAIINDEVEDYLREWYKNRNWFEIYDLLEFISALAPQINVLFLSSCNEALKKESAGYRIINKRVVRITSEEEVKEIEEALGKPDKWQPVTIHLITALKYLGDRSNPDYRNSVKESISSVESLCTILTGEKDATLGKALSSIEKKWKLHGALKSAFSSLYGYTSDSGGIRHSLLEDDIQVTFEDAKFMLVSCSAFVNYLIAKTS
jgi:hypothetical protein